MIEFFELKLKAGQLFEIECSRDDLDTLIALIGEDAVEYCEEL